MRILAIGITFCLVFYTVCVSDQDDYNPLSDEEANAAIKKALDTINPQNDYDAGIAAYKRGHYSVAFSNFESRAMDGDPVAQFCLGFMYKNHSEIAVTDRDLTEVQREVKSREQAKKWYTKAADQEYLPAQNNLGVMYVRLYEASDEGMKALPLLEALKWFRKAAEAERGYARSQFNLCIISGHENTAVEWARKAADQGYAPAQDHLGSLYYHGNGVDKNLKLAVKWFRAAAEQGYPPAQNNLGVCYAEGFEVDEDLEKAFKWSKKAAEQGNANGQFATALSYMRGEGVDENINKAFRWYKEAAEQNHVSAQNNLAKMYTDFAVQYKKDKDEKRSKYCTEMANRWYLRAAQSGNPIAQWNIGRRFEEGKDEVPQDSVEAYYWYSLAFKNKAGLKGSTVKVSDVDKARERVRKSLKDALEDDEELIELISQIQKQVDDWQPKQLVARGTGFYVKKNHILTNAHVVVWEEKPGIHRFYDEFHIPYRRVLPLKDIDLEIDLALLYDKHRKIDESENEFANFRLKDIEVGEKIISFGYPHSDQLSYKGNLTEGVVSGLLYPITSPRPEIGFQHTAPTQPGNSGGPVLDTSGDVVGISVMILPDYVYLSEGIGAYPPEIINIAQNMNFAIRYDVIMDFLSKHYILRFKAGQHALAVLREEKKGIKTITLQEIHAKADKITVPVLCFKNKKQDPMSVEEIGINGLKE